VPIRGDIGIAQQRHIRQHQPCAEGLFVALTRKLQPAPTPSGTEAVTADPGHCSLPSAPWWRQPLTEFTFQPVTSE
jgi:hypothetical protein